MGIRVQLSMLTGLAIPGESRNTAVELWMLPGDLGGWMQLGRRQERNIEAKSGPMVRDMVSLVGVSVLCPPLAPLKIPLLLVEIAGSLGPLHLHPCQLHESWTNRHLPSAIQGTRPQSH